MYDSYDLFAHTDEHLTRPKFKTNRSKHFYPSEASVKVFDEHGDPIVHGGCLRASYFRCTGDFDGVPFDARTEFIFMQGNSVEAMLVSIWKEMGIWIGNNVKFLDEENNISGELDAILVEPPHGQLYGVEVKSFYGYYAKRGLFGNTKVKGFPKMSQLLQTLIYCWIFRDRLPYFRMVYFARDDVDRRTFKVELHREGDIYYPMVDGEVVRQFSIQDILARYALLQHHIDTQVVPPRDFDLMYSDAKIEDFWNKKKVSKTKYEAWKNGKLKPYEHVGDWQCSYCKYRNICYADNS